MPTYAKNWNFIYRRQNVLLQNNIKLMLKEIFGKIKINMPEIFI